MTTDLTKKLDALERPNKRPTQCRVCLLPDELRAAVERALARRAFRQDIADVLAAEGHKVSRNSIDRHVNQEHNR